MEVPSGRLPKIEELWISRGPLALRAPTKVLIGAAMIAYTILVTFYSIYIILYIYILYTPQNPIVLGISARRYKMIRVRGKCSSS